VTSSFSIRHRAPLALGLLIVLASCSGHTPAQPTPATPAVTAVQVGIAGNAAPTLAPGETRQLFAMATQNDGTSIDVTNLATWQSSAPGNATVSASGLVTAAAEGAVDVSATYKTTKGSLHVDVQACAVSVSPATASFNAFGGTTTLTVSVNSPSCRWTARSDQPWFPLSIEPSAPGGGSFSYTLPPNSTTSARTAKVIVSTPNGLTALHAITEDRPLACSYVTQPDEITFSASGGSGQFNVITTPGDCRWNVLNGMSSLGVFVTSGFSGTGNGLIRYSVQANTRTTDADGFIEIAGQSGLNPNGRHHIIILKR
jgi:Bacterial Ig-like domain (group 2)